MEACMKSDDKELIAQMTRALIFPESMGLLEEKVATLTPGLYRYTSWSCKAAKT